MNTDHAETWSSGHFKPPAVCLRFKEFKILFAQNQSSTELGKTRLSDTQLGEGGFPRSLPGFCPGITSEHFGVETIELI